MKMRRFKRTAAAVAAITVVSLCLTVALYRAAGCFPLIDDTALAAGYLSFDNGSLYQPVTEAPLAALRPMTPSSEAPPPPTERPTVPSGSGVTYPVIETSIREGDIGYGNVQISNSTPVEPDIAALLDSDLPFALEDNHTVQVLIYHTHTCESYMTEDTGEYDADFYPRSTDGSQGVIAVGDRIAETLKAHGIGVVHDKTLHDDPSYEGSYGRSRSTAESYCAKYPGIKVTLDIHRDSMTNDSGTKYKPVFTHDGKKAAQIMIMSGYNEEGEFPFWDENLIFATHLQQRCEEMYPGMTRPLYFGEFKYNMNINNGSLLIEVGTDANTVDEACRTGEFLANALSSVLQKG